MWSTTLFLKFFGIRVCVGTLWFIFISLFVAEVSAQTFTFYTPDFGDDFGAGVLPTPLGSFSPGPDGHATIITTIVGVDGTEIDEIIAAPTFLHLSQAKPNDANTFIASCTWALPTNPTQQPVNPCIFVDNINNNLDTFTDIQTMIPYQTFVFAAEPTAPPGNQGGGGTGSASNTVQSVGSSESRVLNPNSVSGALSGSQSGSSGTGLSGASGVSSGTPLSSDAAGSSIPGFSSPPTSGGSRVPTTTLTSPNTTVPSSSSSHSNTTMNAAIIGGVVGGILCILILLGILVYLLRQRRLATAGSERHGSILDMPYQNPDPRFVQPSQPESVTTPISGPPTMSPINSSSDRGTPFGARAFGLGASAGIANGVYPSEKARARGRQPLLPTLPLSASTPSSSSHSSSSPPLTSTSQSSLLVVTPLSEVPPMPSIPSGISQPAAPASRLSSLLHQMNRIRDEVARIEMEDPPPGYE